ncbi:MAG: GNAT family protein [Actinomycetes bacterium]|nr:N-acetyltransferase [Acidimicrobiia bacterium]
MASFRPVYPIRTDRLTLRPWQPNDLDFVADLFSRPDVVRYLYYEVQDRPGAEEMLGKRIEKVAIENEGDAIVLAVEADGVLVGEALLQHVSAKHRQGEVGWILHPDHRGHGYATEAARAMLRLAFDGLRLHRVVARSDGRNDASVAVMERLGMRQEAHFVENEFVKGEWTDEIVYAMLEDEWRTKR